MIDELNQAIQTYQTKWQKLLAGRKNKEFFLRLKPTAVGWKVADREEYQTRLAEWHDRCDKIIETWMNGRWIAKLHLKETLAADIKILKVMQRRPGSDDALGLDHLDFYSPDIDKAETILNQEKDLKWTHETNDIRDDYAWISMWFDDTEAKLKSNTVLTIIAAELKDMEKEILNG